MIKIGDDRNHIVSWETGKSKKDAINKLIAWNAKHNYSKPCYITICNNHGLEDERLNGQSLQEIIDYLTKQDLSQEIDTTQSDGNPSGGPQ